MVAERAQWSGFGPYGQNDMTVTKRQTALKLFPSVFLWHCLKARASVAVVMAPT